MILHIVVATDENRAIGKDNSLLWHLPADLKHFKTITSGHTVIMGRKTFESIGKPLPNRRNIVITSNVDYVKEDVSVANSFEDALELCKSEENVFVIGGARVFNDALSLTHTLYLTIVHHKFKDADTFFPELNLSEWNEQEKHPHKADEKNKYDYTFITYTKK